MNFTTILKKEILENIYNFKYGIILALSVLVISVSTVTMYRDYTSRIENYEILRPESKEATAIISPSPLSIFVKGLDENISRSYEFDVIGISLGSSQQAVNQLFKLFTTPDLLFIIKIVLSLCALLMAYDIISREKENSTLRLLFANSVKRPTVLLAKWVGGFISFIVPILFVLLLTICLVGLLPSVQFTTTDYGKIAMFIFISILYLAIFFTFAFCVSCLVSKSVTSLIISLFFWVMVVFVIPNLGNTISKQVVKSQSLEQLELEQNLTWIKSIFDIHSGKSQTFETGWEKLSLAYAVEMNKLTQVSKSMSKISPAGVYTLFANDIMNTGLMDESALKNSVWEYYNLVKNSKSDSDGNLKGDFPVFNHQRCSLSIILAENTSSLAILIFFVILFFVGAYAAFMKYDLR